MMIVVAHVWQTILQNVQQYGLTFRSGHVHGDEAASSTPMILTILERIHETMFRVLGALLPDMGQMNYGDLVAQGVNAPLSWLMAISYGVFWQALLYVVAMVFLAYLLFVRKEVAQQ